MRPNALIPYFASVQSLPGIGPKTAPAFARLLDADAGDTARIFDLVTHMPSDVIDRRSRPAVRDAVPGKIVTLVVRVVEHRPPPRGSRAPYRVVCEDDTASLILVFFNGQPNYLQRQLPVGDIRLVSGRLEAFNDQVQIVHPDHIVNRADGETLPLVEPSYPLTAGLSQNMVRKAIEAAVGSLSALPEWDDAGMVASRQWPGFLDAVATIHRPASPQDCAPSGRAWQRLAYDELLSGQLALALLRRRVRQRGGVARNLTGTVSGRMSTALPFSLTGAQSAAIADIAADFAKPERMLRLIQGDVGSGKTVVAALAMAMAAEDGAQSALMAPTEILARQHFATLSPLTEAAGLTIAILTSREKGAARTQILAGLMDGTIDIVIGTHALFQSQVAFKNLGLAVIDEQHRFGVHQRLTLAEKGGPATEILVMTATPIPRTLVLTYYGDMDVSLLAEKPPGRMPVDTFLVAADRTADLMNRLGSHLEDGGQAYWVCPLVDEGETIEAVSATDRHSALAALYGDRITLVHGRMNGSEKEAAMARFAAGQSSVLVATTVIEVGVDVPNASIMIIENAERFGLAQLHQLRGRVGRGDVKSSCVLIYRTPLSETAEARLRMMRETEDGFRIAEEDLRLRGGGEVLGTRQSGSPLSRVAVPAFHAELVPQARNEANAALEADPTLSTPRGEALRILLHLFGRTDALKLVEAG